MLFMQQSRCEMCILSASGSISNASLRQPATSGGNITYEGRFEIISLTGSYVCNELGGQTGGLSVCLSNNDGQIIGGGVGGPLKAAGPVQVIVGTFFIDTKKDSGGGVKGDASASKLPSPVGESASSLGFSQTVESSSGNPIQGNDCMMEDWEDLPYIFYENFINAGFELTGMNMNSSGFGKTSSYGVRE